MLQFKHSLAVSTSFPHARQAALLQHNVGCLHCFHVLFAAIEQACLSFEFVEEPVHSMILLQRLQQAALSPRANMACTSSDAIHHGSWQLRFSGGSEEVFLHLHDSSLGNIAAVRFNDRLAP